MRFFVAKRFNFLPAVPLCYGIKDSYMVKLSRLSGLPLKGLLLALVRFYRLFLSLSLVIDYPAFRCSFEFATATTREIDKPRCVNKIYICLILPFASGADPFVPGEFFYLDDLQGSGAHFTCLK